MLLPGPTVACKSSQGAPPGVLGDLVTRCRVQAEGRCRGRCSPCLVLLTAYFLVRAWWGGEGRGILGGFTTPHHSLQAGYLPSRKGLLKHECALLPHPPPTPLHF